MKLTNEEWQELCLILEHRSYRYSDEDDTTSAEYKIFDNIQKRIRNSSENSIQRFTKEQKTFLIEMLGEFLETITETIVEDVRLYEKLKLNTNERLNNTEETIKEIKCINSMLYKLTKNTYYKTNKILYELEIIK